jgi:hypothetical protein
MCFYIPETVGIISVNARGKMTVLHLANGTGLPRHTSVSSEFCVHVVPILCLRIGFMYKVNILMVYFIVTVTAAHVVGLQEASIYSPNHVASFYLRPWAYM